MKKRCGRGFQTTFRLFLTVLLVGLGLATGGETFAQELRLYAPSEIYAGRPFELKFTVDAKASDFKPPSWGRIDVQFGPSTGVQQKTQWVNGRVSSQVEYSFTFVCVIDKPGKYEVGPATVRVDGREVKSQPQTLEALAPDSAPRHTPSARPGATPPAQGQIEDSDLYIQWEVNRRRVFKGEPLIAKVRLMSRVRLLNLDYRQLPKLDGFWSKNRSPQQLSITRTVRDGKEYNTALVQEFVLYPQKTGQLLLDPVELEASYLDPGRRRSVFDDFFGSHPSSTKVLRAPAVPIDVRPLPSGAPPSFAGAVGKYSVRAGVDRQELVTNEAVTYTLTVSGRGNLQLLSEPRPEFPSTVEVFPPKVKPNYRFDGGEQAGSISYEYVLIPRAPGEIILPSFHMACFNPKTKKYEVSSTEVLTLSVRADSTQQAVITAGVVNKEDVKYIGQDIRHIHLGSGGLMVLGDSFIGSVAWWVLLFALVLVFGAGWIFMLRRNRLLADVALARGKKARRLAQRRLRLAKRYMDEDDNQFYEELVRAIWGYLSDKLSISVAELSVESVGEQLASRGADQEVIATVRELISDCEYARYAPEALGGSKDSLYGRALRALEQVDGSLKHRGRRG